MVLYEGAPTYPDGGRFWKICQTHGVTIFYTAPTAIRALMKLGDEIPAKYDLSKLRLLGSVGEPINPEAWIWYQRVDRRRALPDRGHVVADGNRRHHDFAGSGRHGDEARLLHAAAARHRRGHRRRPRQERDGRGHRRLSRHPQAVAAMLRTIWGDNERYVSTYWEKFQNRYYVAGDSAHRDKDGYFWIMGRIDDVLNVAGHRLGTMEIESALVSHPRVAEAAVVGQAARHQGRVGVRVRRVPRRSGRRGMSPKLTKELRNWVAQELGAIARPDDIRFADNLPKTRSGKIMRRLLRTDRSRRGDHAGRLYAGEPRDPRPAPRRRHRPPPVKAAGREESAR